MRETQYGKLTTSKKMSIFFFLLEFSATKIISFKCHIDNCVTGRYVMILGRYLLTALVLDLTFSENIAMRGEE